MTFEEFRGKCVAALGEKRGDEAAYYAAIYGPTLDGTPSDVHGRLWYDDLWILVKVASGLEE